MPEIKHKICGKLISISNFRDSVSDAPIAEKYSRARLLKRPRGL